MDGLLYAYTYTIVPIIKLAMEITLLIFAVILLNQMIKFVRLKNEAMLALKSKDASGGTQD